MLSLADSDTSRSQDRTASTLDTVDSVGIRLGVTECFSPYVSLISFRSYFVFIALKSCQFRSR